MGLSLCVAACTREGAFPAMLRADETNIGTWISCSSYIWAGPAFAKLPAVEPHNDHAQTWPDKGRVIVRKTRNAVLKIR